MSVKNDPDLFEMREVDAATVLKAINNLNNSSAKDIYKLDAAFLKKHSHILVNPLTHVINTSIRTSQFPDIWKKALVKPIYKSGSTDEVANYRPISLLPVMSKVLDKIIQLKQLQTIY